MKVKHTRAICGELAQHKRHVDGTSVNLVFWYDTDACWAAIGRVIEYLHTERRIMESEAHMRIAGKAP